MVHLGRCNLLRVSPRKANYCFLYSYSVLQASLRTSCTLQEALFLATYPNGQAGSLTLVPTHRSPSIDRPVPTNKATCRPWATHNWALPCGLHSPPLPCKPVANVFIYQSARHEPGMRCAAQPCNTMAKTYSSRTHSPPCPVPQFLLPGPVHPLTFRRGLAATSSNTERVKAEAVDVVPRLPSTPAHPQWRCLVSG